MWRCACHYVVSLLECRGGGTYNKPDLLGQKKTGQNSILINRVSFLRYEDFFWELCHRADGGKEIIFESIL
jgi:hypothetical protein